MRALVGEGKIGLRPSPLRCNLNRKVRWPIRAPATLDFKGQVACVRERYREAQKQLGLTPATAVFQRIFLSDVLNQAAFVRDSGVFDDSVAVSIVQQPPLPGAKIALLAYHIVSPDPLANRLASHLRKNSEPFRRRTTVK